MMRDPYHESMLLVGFLWEWEWGVVWVAAGPTSLGVFVDFQVIWGKEYLNSP